MEGRGVKQDLIPNVGQLEYVNVSLKEWIIDPDIHGLLDAPSGVAHLPANYGKIVHTDDVLRGVPMVIEGEGALRCSFSLLTPYIFLLTIHLVTLIPVDCPTFLSDIIPVLWVHQDVLDGVASLKVDPNLMTNNLEVFAEPVSVWDYYVNVSVVVDAVVTCWMAVVIVLGLVNVLSIVAISLKSV